MFDDNLSVLNLAIEEAWLMKKLGRLIPLLVAGLFGVAASGMAPSDLPAVNQRIAQFNRQVPTDHPRLFVLKPELPEFRQFVRAAREQRTDPAVFKNAVIEPSDLPLPPEPAAPRGNSAAERQVWRQGYATAFKAGSKAQQYAFSYLLTAEPAQGREAVRWLVHLSDWDVNGGISLKANDEAFIQSLWPMLYAYDWAYDALTAAERAVVLKAFEVRLRLLFDHITRKFTLTRPTPADNSLSHPMRFISTLGIAGLVLYQDLPEAPKYLAWAYEYYLRQFPVWGGADGGWSEGLNYWATATNQHFQFLDAMRTLGLTEIFAKPFFRNSGYFALYNLPPYPGSSFGDLCNIIGPNPNTALIFEKYALLYQDPYLLKYFQILFQRYPSGLDYYQFSYFDTIFHLFRKSRTPLAARELAELPRSRYFADIGWAAFHSKLGDKTGDIMLGFKSSPYGSASHSFSDQNSFVINAFGEPLAISSGYREWYGSPHHDGWTRTTAAKNAVLFGGAGQPIRDAKASGAITRFFTGDRYDFVSGDATRAYGPNATKALRHVLFVDGRYFVILDELASAKPLSHQWLLHAKAPFTFKPATAELAMEYGGAGLNARFLTPAPSELRFSQTDQFTVPVHPDFAAKMPNEWHATVWADHPRQSRQFLTVLQPYPKGKRPETDFRPLKAVAGYACTAREAHQEDLIFFATEEQRRVDSVAGQLRGLAAVVSRREQAASGFLIVSGTSLRTPRLALRADRPLSLEGRFEAVGLKLTVAVDGPTELQLRLDFEPQAIRGVEPTNWSFRPETKILSVKLSQNSSIFIM
jgi:hypothetical protein